MPARSTLSPSVRDAGMRLLRAGISHKRVIAVDVDSILYLSPGGDVMTGWVRRVDGRERIFRERGMPADAGPEVPALLGDRPAK